MSPEEDFNNNLGMVGVNQTPPPIDYQAAKEAAAKEIKYGSNEFCMKIPESFRNELRARHFDQFPEDSQARLQPEE